MEKPHEIEIDTRNGTFRLDGKDLIDSVMECSIRYRGAEKPIVTLTVIADVMLHDTVSVEEKRLCEGGQ